MPDKSFAELVSDAPEAAGAGTVSLVGVLGRSKDPTKFVLNLADGRAITLDMDAVSDHQVLSGATGQTVVRVGLEASRVPQDALIPSPSYLYKTHTDPPPGGGPGITGGYTGPPDAPPTTNPLSDAQMTGLWDLTLAWIDVQGVRPPQPALSINPPDPTPFSLAVPPAFQAMMAPPAAWWYLWQHRPKVLTDGSLPFGPTPDI